MGMRERGSTCERCLFLVSQRRLGRGSLAPDPVILKGLRAGDAKKPETARAALHRCVLTFAAIRSLLRALCREIFIWTLE